MAQFLGNLTIKMLPLSLVGSIYFCAAPKRKRKRPAIVSQVGVRAIPEITILERSHKMVGSDPDRAAGIWGRGGIIENNIFECSSFLDIGIWIVLYL